MTQAQKSTDIVFQIAALIYYDEHKKEKQFEELNAEEQKPFMARAVKFLQALDKLNKRVSDKVDPHEEFLRRQKNINILTEIVEKFVKGLKTTRPEMFPAKELAMRIMNGG